MKILCTRPSRTASALSKRLKIGRQKKAEPFTADLVLNWGVSKHPEITARRVLNPIEAVKVAVNKLTAFERLGSLSVPWTTDPKEAVDWKKVVCRTRLKGRSGEGIIIYEDKDLDMPEAKVYTKYVPKTSEWRLHVAFGEIIDIQRKILRPDLSEEEKERVDFDVRNHSGGFVYVRGSTEPCRDSTKKVALEAVEALGLDFGAVDIIWNQKHGRDYVLEVNTAPGLVGTTLDNYVEAFKPWTS